MKPLKCENNIDFRFGYSILAFTIVADFLFPSVIEIVYFLKKKNMHLVRIELNTITEVSKN